MSNTHNWKTLVEHRHALAESPVWDTERKRLLWVDILTGEIYSYIPGENKHNIFKTGQLTGAIALRENGGLVAALEHGFYFIDLENKSCTPVADPERHLPQNRFNDGKCDPAGRFWAGTMPKEGSENSGKLYMLNTDGSFSVKIDRVGCSNGMGWSPDHRTFYYIDTLSRQIMAYAYCAGTGDISGGRVVVEILASEGYPDGMCVDEQGMLWVAIWGGSKVCRFDPLSGNRLDQIDLPVSQVSSCCFGGQNLNDLYITSARQGLSDAKLQEQPLAGSIFVVSNLKYKGLSSFSYKG